MICNGWLYIIRNKNRSLIIFVILLVLLSSLFACISIQRTTKNLKDDLNKLTNSSLIVTKKNGEEFNKEKFSKYEKIKEISPIYNSTAIAKGINVVNENQKVKRDNIPDNLKNAVAYEAVLNTERNVLFQSDVFTIKSGHHIQSSDKKSVLVHEVLAKMNHLKVGDTVQLLQPGTKKMMTYKIRGIFSGKKQEKYTGLTSDFSENMMFLSYQSIQKNRVNKLELVTDNPDKVLHMLEQNEDIKANYKIEKNNSSLEDKVASYNGMREMMQWMNYIIFAGGIISLSLVLSLWTRERIYEVAILLSLGISKVMIIIQFVFELILVSLSAAIPAYFLGKLVIVSMFANLMRNSRDISHLQSFGMSYCILLIIIVVSIIVSSFFMLLQPPKKLLSKIS